MTHPYLYPHLNRHQTPPSPPNHTIITPPSTHITHPNRQLLHTPRPPPHQSHTHISTHITYADLHSHHVPTPSPTSPPTPSPTLHITHPHLQLHHTPVSETHTTHSSTCHTQTSSHTTHPHQRSRPPPKSTHSQRTYHIHITTLLLTGGACAHGDGGAGGV